MALRLERKKRELNSDIYVQILAGGGGPVNGNRLRIPCTITEIDPRTRESRSIDGGQTAPRERWFAAIV
ncbi:MAG: hypothetical protein HZB38_05795 [Planctomycetes bacterium]|nr:hypothetical protein [Planctomycetota bacterium]